MEKNVLLTIEYDGTGFSGWQRQPAVRTVQGVVEDVLSEALDQDIKVSGVSRTDAGVHARDQKAMFKADMKIPVDSLAKVLNNRLQGRPESRAENDDIRVVSAEEITDTDNIRQLVTGKTYRYSIRNSETMPVFNRNYRYLVKPELDVQKMREAAGYIEGTHDFRCFQAAGGEPGKTTVRTIRSLSISEVPAADMDGGAVCAADDNDGSETARDIFIDITGDGFLYNMVRIIAGTLVEVGLGKRKPEALKGIIESCDRQEAGHTAPPQGLCLMCVYLSENDSR